MVRNRCDEERLTAYRDGFAALFREWRVTLPDDAVVRQPAGEVRSEAGSIQYRLHEDWGDQYLEILTSGRNRDHRLYRIHGDGRAELIAASLDRAACATVRGRDEEHRFYHLVSDRGFDLPHH
jgi:hypothetical protein